MVVWHHNNLVEELAVVFLICFITILHTKSPTSVKCFLYVFKHFLALQIQAVSKKPDTSTFGIPPV